ncbi:MAG TPA: alpha/beta hydrolase [Bacteroidetes bacterium]|nr:alpha/beta hydrolase [Bacteroidota bacterium]
MEIRTCQTNSGPLEYSIYGEGIPLLLLHGGHGNAREMMTHRFLDPAQFTLITPSRPGYGGTPLSQNKSPVAAARQIEELMQKLPYEQYNLIGISAGGPTAIALAGLYPERVTKLVLESAVTHRWLRPGDALYTKGKRLFHPRIESVTWAMLRFFLRLFPGKIIRMIAEELSAGSFASFSPDEIQRMKAMLHNQRSGSGFVTDLEHELPANLINKVVAPTLIVHSKNDLVVGPDHPKHAQKFIPNAKTIWLDNKWGHLIWMGETAQGIIGQVSKFLLETP